jgi:hypothetical protein
MSSSLVALIFGIVIVAVFVWWLWMLIEALKTPSGQWSAAGQNQVVYVVLMILLGVIGTVLYIAVARPQLRRAVSPQT